jgi:hypothetical protein
MMVGKLAAVILLATGTAAGMLSVRQQRLQAVHDTARAIQSAAELDRQLWSVRLEVASRLSPDHLRRALADLERAHGPLSPIFSDWCDTLPPDIRDAIESGEPFDPAVLRDAGDPGDVFTPSGPPQ